MIHCHLAMQPEIWHFRLEKLQSESLSTGLSTQEPIGVLLVVTNERCESCKLPTEEVEEVLVEEVTAGFK